jgi:U3 small nucleolar RNA-associated protein 21
MSGLPPAHWKNLFHLELVKARNKPKEAPKKPPTAPFFLQWRPRVATDGEATLHPETTKTEEPIKNDDDKWDAAWSDDENEQGFGDDNGLPRMESEAKREREEETADTMVAKKRKVTHYRSQLAEILARCASQKPIGGKRFQAVTDHIATLGPSSIDVSFNSLCSGMHDLEGGLPLLILGCRWLLEACKSRERFEAVNAYLHRFLHLHSNTLAGIDDFPDDLKEGTPEQADELQQQREDALKYITLLRKEQQSSSEALQNKMKNTICLLRHFSRMV